MAQPSIVSGRRGVESCTPARGRRRDEVLCPLTAELGAFPEAHDDAARPARTAAALVDGERSAVVSLHRDRIALRAEIARRGSSHRRAGPPSSRRRSSRSLRSGQAKQDIEIRRQDQARDLIDVNVPDRRAAGRWGVRR
jgi:hypothetical protein